jgi:hypothetical protein
MVEWLAGNRIRGTSTERTTTSGFSPISAVSGGWKELDRATLTSGAASTIDVSSIPDKRYYMVLLDFPRSGTSQCGLTFNNVSTGTEYSRRYNYNYGSDSAPSGEAYMDFTGNGSSTNNFAVFFIANKTDAEKLVIMYGNEGGSTGSGNMGDARNQIGKWNNVSSAINRITAIVSANNYAQGAEMVVLGYDPDDTHTDNFWEELASGDQTSVTSSSTGTITAKKYLWIQAYLDPSTTTRLDINFNNVTSGTEYGRKGSSNSGTTYNSPSQNQLAVAGTDGTEKFVNMFFLNKSGSEKLGISYAVNQNSAGAGNSPARQENILKWAETTNQITEIDFVQGDGASMDRIIYKVWGSN